VVATERLHHLGGGVPGTEEVDRGAIKTYNDKSKLKEIG
jgi:hypothetical protein